MDFPVRYVKNNQMVYDPVSPSKIGYDIYSIWINLCFDLTCRDLTTEWWENWIRWFCFPIAGRSWNSYFQGELLHFSQICGFIDTATKSAGHYDLRT